ncbi:MAG TPA: translation initiation factor 2 [Symbiobacteriaceae bacterium]|nr:translation initiation factor 2 [Symbiobacteriaceae bacterium]
MEHVDEVDQLRQRVRVLEERVQGLRASRRILMNLIAAQEREKRLRIQRLEAENTRLQKQSSRFAKALVERNIRIIRLEENQRRDDEESIS